MGSNSSKPLSSIRNFDRDSVILCDGHNRLQNPKYAGTSEGRYVFILGNMHVTSDGFQDDSQELAVSFQLDVIDLFLSKRTRIGNISDFYNFGHPTGFYSLNERTVVLVDYDPIEKTLRQRLISIDLSKETVQYRINNASTVLVQAECTFYRGYEVNLDAIFRLQTSSGEEYAVTVTPRMIGSDQSGVVYPLNPLSTKPHKEITTLIDQANVHVRQFYTAGEAGEAHVSTFHPPFFISNAVLGFFIDPNCVDDLIDPMKVLVMDLTSSSFYIQEAKSSSSFPLSYEKSRPAYAKWSQSTNREVALLSRFRRTGRCWQVGAAWLILGLFQYTVYAAVFMWSWNWRRLGGFCLHASMKMLYLRSALLEPKTEKFTGFGILNTRTLEWSEIKATMWNEEETSLVPLRDGTFLVASMTSEKTSNRVIGLDILAQQKMERFRLIGNPLRMSSLSRLSSIAVQKNSRVPSEVLEQIAARMIA